MSVTNKSIDEKVHSILSEQALQIIKHLNIGAYVVSPEREIYLWNDKAKEITGYSQEEVEGAKCQDNILRHVDDNGTELCIQGCPLHETIKDGQLRKARVYLRHKTGFRMPVKVETLPIMLNNEIKGAIELFQEDTEELNLLEELRRTREKALICPLTEIGNRRYTEQVLEDRLEEMKRLKSSLGLFFMDIDDFKCINDTYGHPIGDIVLKMVARTLVNIMRPYDFVGRWGGEEMVAIIPHVKQEELYPLGERFRKLISASSIKTTQGRLNVTVSIGATISNENDTIQSIIERADQMMYISKREGKNRVTVYNG
ncbi:MAG TPA: sensor domain-containing diguanylate cyclase [Candidatus Hydrogenedens sp.]|nr:sensor domain-containing diguanylate cyclase [Candidatus Hydrogenedens sp.]